MFRWTGFLVVVGLASAVHAARPVARWDVVPYQRVKGDFAVGLVAFHEQGVKVKFTVDGKPAGESTKAALNKRTGVVEHFFILRAARYADGPLTVGATVTSGDGSVCKLPDLPLYADTKGKLGSKNCIWVDPKRGNEFSEGTAEKPVKTIHRAMMLVGDGGTIYLTAGVYPLKLIGGGVKQKKRNYWTSVEPAKGVAREQVVLQSGRPGTDKIRFRNVSLTCNVTFGYGSIVIGENGKASAWFDNCDFCNEVGKSGNQSGPFGNRLRAYVTGGTTHDIAYGPQAELVRNHVVRDISLVAFNLNDCLVVNSKVSGIAPDDSTSQADVFHSFGTSRGFAENAIAYGVEVTDCRGRIFAGSNCRDITAVGIRAEATGGELVHSQFMNVAENMLLADVTIAGQDWQWYRVKNDSANFAPKDVRLFKVKTDGFSGFSPVDGSAGLKIDADYDIISNDI